MSLELLDLKEPSMKSWRAVLRRDPCAYCGGQSRDVDHIVPITLHPRDWDGPENEIGTCRRCNAQKNSGTLLAKLSGLAVGQNHRTAAARRKEEFNRQQQADNAKEQAAKALRDEAFKRFWLKKFGTLPPADLL